MALHDDPGRRAFGRSAAVLLGAVLADCTGDGLGDVYSSPEHTPIDEECEQDHQEVLDLRVRNRDSEPRVVELTVTGERADAPSETVFEETFELRPDEPATRAVAFDPSEEDIERYDDFVAGATTDDGRTDTEGVYSTVVASPLRYGLRVTVESDGRLTVQEIHWDASEDYDGVTC